MAGRHKICDTPLERALKAASALAGAVFLCLALLLFLPFLLFFRGLAVIGAGSGCVWFAGMCMGDVGGDPKKTKPAEAEEVCAFGKRPFRAGRLKCFLNLH